jgi:hypothetical protein
MENVNPLNPKQLGTYQKLPRPANHFTQGAEKNSPHPQTWRKIGKREKCGLVPCRGNLSAGGWSNISFRPNNRQPVSTAGYWESLLPCHSDADSFLRRDEVIKALSVLSNGELDALDVT